jgi:hypothetical protein
MGKYVNKWGYLTREDVPKRLFGLLTDAEIQG